jgi:hypothetical protein
MMASGPLLAIIAVVVALGSKFFLFIYDYAVNIFYWDQWDFLTPFFQGRTALTNLFLYQYGPHRMGLGLISLKLLYPATHWSARAESFLIGGCIFAAMLLALFLKRQLFGAFAYSDAAIPLLFLTLMQYETFIGPSNPSYSAFPLLLIFLYCLGFLLPGRLLRYGFILLLNFLLIYTGFGLFMGAVTIGVFGLESYRNLRGIGKAQLAYSMGALLIACGSLGSFFIHYRFRPAVECFEFPYHNFMAYPWFVAVLFSAFLGPRGPVFLVTAIGAVVLLVAVVALVIQFYRVVRPDHDRASLVGFVLISYSLLFSINAAIGRVCLGVPGAAQAPRYSTLVIPAYLGIYFYLLSITRSQLRNLAVVCFLILIIPGGVVIPNYSGHKLADGKRAWAACFLRAHDVAYCDQTTGFPVYPHPAQNGLRQKLEYLEERRLGLFYELR